MVRSYRRFSNRARWSEESLRKAAEEIKKKTDSYNNISKKFGIPLRTLLRRVKQNKLQKGVPGPSGSLGIVNEEKLVNYIKKMEESGFPLTGRDVRHIAFTFAEKYNIKHRFNNDTRCAGYDWLNLFLRRNPSLTIRKPEALSSARAFGMNREEVNRYFNLLHEAITDYNLTSKPGKIFNMDETGLQLNNKPEKVIASKGKRSVQTMTSVEKGETITVISCVNAEGSYIPPYIIFKGKRKKPEFEDGLPPGSQVVMSPDSAYVNTHIFLSWITDHFLPRKEPGPALLILDGHSSHLSDVNVLDFVAEKEIILLSLPPHTTHYLQPLDRSFFKPLKSFWNQACSKWIHNNPGRRITRLQFGTLLNEAWSKAATVSNAVNGFRACGIHPYDPTAIPEEAFAISDRCLNGKANNTMESSANSTGNTQSAPSTAFSNGTNPNVHGEHQRAEPQSSSSRQRTLTPDFEAILSVPILPEKSRNSRKQHSEIVTALSYRQKKRKLMEEKELKNRKTDVQLRAEKQMKKAPKRRKLGPSKTSSDQRWVAKSSTAKQ